jgi:hypothetical protein
MFREVDAGADYSMVTDPWVLFPESDRNAWFVYLMAGPLSSVVPYFPHPQILVGYERLNVVRWHSYERFRRLATPWTPSSDPTTSPD